MRILSLNPYHLVVVPLYKFSNFLIIALLSFRGTEKALIVTNLVHDLYNVRKYGQHPVQHYEALLLDTLYKKSLKYEKSYGK